MLQLPAPPGKASGIVLTKLAQANCSNAYPEAKQGLVKLELAMCMMTRGGLMNFMEHYVAQLPEKVRRLLSHYGAVSGLGAGHSWIVQSHDAMNVIYSTVWEHWKGEEACGRFPWCRSIINWNTAGNLLECLMGVGFIHVHHHEGQVLNEISVTETEHEEAQDFVRAFGSTIVEWVPIVELAILGVESVWNACPWIQTTKGAYKIQLMLDHLHALRFGFISGYPFFRRKLPVFPVMSWHLYPDDVRKQLAEELNREELAEEPDHRLRPGQPSILLDEMD